jgi:hypothetical protein
MAQKVWECKIGFATEDELGPTADGPMRFAVQMMFKVLTGHDAAFTFSGWGGQLTETEREYVDADVKRA